MAKIYYSQVDARWKNHPYPANAVGYTDKTIGSSGCGPTCAAMVVSSARETVTPAQMGDIFRQQGFRVAGGTAWSAFNWVAQNWRLETKEVRSSYDALQACKEGYFVVINVGAGLWTTGGHYILAVGADGDRIQIYDPYLYTNKFNRNGRAGKVDLQSISAWVQIDTFKAASNAQRFYAYKVDDGAPVQPQPETPTIKTKYVNTNGSNLNVRNAPGGAVVGSLKKGTQVTVYSEQNGWSQIGSTNWVSSQYLSDNNPNNTTPVTPSTSQYSTGTYKVTASLLKVRTGAGTGFAAKSWNQLSANAREQNRRLGNSKANGYLKGVVCSVSQVKGNWGLTSSGWICLAYCAKQ